jgi:hypothetical protein
MERDEWLHFTETKNRNSRALSRRGKTPKPKHRAIPILPELRASIDACPSGHLVVGAYGRPLQGARRRSLTGSSALRAALRVQSFTNYVAVNTTTYRLHWRFAGQRLEHAAVVATKSGDWALLSVIDSRLHALDEFTNRLYAPILDGLSAADITHSVTRIERVIVDDNGEVVNEHEASHVSSECEPLEPMPAQPMAHKPCPPPPQVESNVVPITSDPPPDTAVFGFSRTGKLDR